jgi:hypothetical protein
MRQPHRVAKGAKPRVRHRMAGLPKAEQTWEDVMKWCLWLAVCAIGLGLRPCGAATPATQPMTFHSGGVGECSGCHSMHDTPNTANGSTNAPGSKTGGPSLLSGSDQSSTCLNCHASDATVPSGYVVMTYPFAGGTNVTSIPVHRTPGGDFSWLKLSFTYMSQGSVKDNPGSGHGHNVVASDYGLTASRTHATAPGGAFPSGSLHCTSCHDPHSKLRRDSTGAVRSLAGSIILPIIGSGSYATSVPGAAGATTGVTAPGTNEAVGVYRLLAGYATYRAAGQQVSYSGVPLAIAPSTYNQTEAINQVRVAYGVGSGTNKIPWGAWCGTCHPAMLGGPQNHHPVDASAVMSTGGEERIYNEYVRSGDLTGNSGGAYLSLVPFMTGSDDVKVLAALADNTGTVAAAKQGPRSSDQASCLSCHRAHASGWRSALRWNPVGELITHVTSTGLVTWPGTDITPSCLEYGDGMSFAQVQAAYYDRPATVFGSFQRSLCNKCHAKD